MSMDRKREKKSWIKRNFLYVIGGSIVMFFIVYFIFFSDNSSKLNVELDKITIEDVKKDIFQDFIAVIGTVEPIHTIFLDATEGGRIEEIYVDEGAMLDVGDIILKLSNDNLILEISNNEAQVAQAVNEVKTLRVNLENQKLNNESQIINLYYEVLRLDRAYQYNQELFTKNHISREVLLLSKEDYEKNKKQYDLLLAKSKKDSVFMESRLAASEESVERMQENLKIIKERLNKLTVKSPCKGELASLTPEIGQVIGYGTRIGTINILDSYKLRVEIDEHYISRIKRELKGDCEFSEVNYKAAITKIYPEVSEGRFYVDMEFIDKIPQDIRIGQTSRIGLELGASKEAILVPRGGFYQSTGGQWIYVIDQTNNFATKRSIKIGRYNPNYFEIIEGLEPGEKVITSGYDNYGNIDKLILKN